MEAMLQMDKIDIKGLQEAYEGKYSARTTRAARYRVLSLRREQGCRANTPVDIPELLISA